MKHPLSVVFIVIFTSFLLVNFPMLGMVESSMSSTSIPSVYLYFYGLWTLLIAIYYLLFRKLRE